MLYDSAASLASVQLLRSRTRSYQCPFPPEARLPLHRSGNRGQRQCENTNCDCDLFKYHDFLPNCLTIGRAVMYHISQGRIKTGARKLQFIQVSDLMPERAFLISR